MHKLKVTSVGNSTGVIIPQALRERLRVERGDTLFAVDTPDGVLLTPYDPEVEKQLEAGRTFMRRYRDTLRTLAK